MSTKALNINQHIPLHNLYPNDCCLCKAEARIQELEYKLDAWFTVFETTQLTHAQCRLETAENLVAKLQRENDELKKELDKRGTSTLDTCY